jgi:hypothetical protein
VLPIGVPAQWLERTLKGLGVNAEAR